MSMDDRYIQHPVCIGSVLWDVVGCSAALLERGNDMPGIITRQPGGVAYNIAERLANLGHAPLLLTALGDDPEGHALMRHCAALNMQTQLIHISQEWHTDKYMAIEDPRGLVAALADAHSLEKAGDAILGALQDGRLGSKEQPFEGMVILDGNLTEALLEQIAQSAYFAACDLRVIPASPGKAHRLGPFFEASHARFYVNLIEAQTLCQRLFAGAEEAALAMVARGAKRAIVTDGAAPVCDAIAGGAAIIVEVPPAPRLRRVTGAGDTFMAAHIHAELGGADRSAALNAAVQAARDFVTAKEDDV